MNASKGRLVFWPAFSAFVSLAIYSKRGDGSTVAALTYATLFGGSVYCIIWGSDQSKQLNRPILALGIALSSSFISTWFLDGIAGPSVIGLGVLGATVLFQRLVGFRRPKV